MSTSACALTALPLSPTALPFLCARCPLTLPLTFSLCVGVAVAVTSEGSLRRDLALLGLPFMFAGERLTVRKREFWNIRNAMRRAQRGGSTVGADLLAACIRYRESSNFYTHLWHDKDTTGTAYDRLQFICISKRIVDRIRSDRDLLADRYMDMTHKKLPTADLLSGWVHLIDCKAGGKALPSAFFVYLQPPKAYRRGGSASSAEHDMAICLAKAASFIEACIAIGTPQPLLSPWGYGQADKCASQAMAYLYTAQRRLAAALPSIWALVERLIKLAEGRLHMGRAALLVVTLPTYCCVDNVAALPALVGGTNAPLSGWWGGAWEIGPSLRSEIVSEALRQFRG